MQRFWFIVLLISTLLGGGCAAPGVARFDYSGSGEIYWPGSPETPRIKYLYSLKHLSSREETALSQAADTLLGEEEFEPARAPTFIRPYGVWVSGGRLYVTDIAATRLTVIDLKTAAVQQWGTEEPAKMLSPIGVIADPAGKVWVTDSLAAKIWLFDRQGKLLSALGEQEDLERPTGIALHKALGRVYVADTARHRILIYELTGKYRGQFGRRGEGAGEFNFPTHLTVDRAGNILVVDNFNFRVQAFDPQGKFLYQWGSMGKGWGNISRPKGIAVDSEDHIYLTEGDMDGVQIFDPRGNLLLYFGESGQEIGQFWLPGGLAIDEEDKIYVADTYNSRIQVFQYLKGR